MQALLGLVAVALAVATFSLPAEAGSYVDDNRSRYEGFIEAASAAGVVSGCNPPANDRFCPHRTVTRAEMAMMLERVADVPAPKVDHFRDDDGLVAEVAINSLAQAGATHGCGQKSFCPRRPLTRGEMASLITTTLGWPLQKVEPERYVDVKRSPHGPALVTLAAHDALEACDPPEERRLCPTEPVTRDEAVFAVSRAAGLDPIDPHNQRTGPEVGFHDGFDELDLWDGRRPSSRNRVGLTANGYRGSGLRVRIPRGSHYGADFKLDLSDVVGEEPETLFFRYYLRVDPGWNPVDSGKLPGFSGIYGRSGKGGYRSSPSSPGWSARMKFSGNRPDDPRARLGYYVYHLGQERRYGDGMNWNEAGKLRPGEWYCIEGQVELNQPGLADGALRGWVDGTLAFEEAGIEFRRPSEPEIKVESFWFNVYYGGKPVAPESMGLTVDEVAVDGRRIGCGAGSGIAREIEGDVDGNGFPDRLWWGECATGPCFRFHQTRYGKPGPVLSLGNGAWFSLDTHRLGIMAVDVDGDDDDDILYRGRCGQSKPCWRVHRVQGHDAGPGLDWGDGARFSGATRQLVAGDFDGNGKEDITYMGRCGSSPHSHPCWRVHLTGKDGFVGPADWGSPADGIDSAPQAAQLTSDGRADILFAAPCRDRSCWFMHPSKGDRFGTPVRLGVARDIELKNRTLFDYDGDGRDDLVTVRGSMEGKGSVLEVRLLTDEGLANPRIVFETERIIEGMSLRRPGAGPVEMSLRSACQEPGGCVEPLVGLSGSLVTPPEHRRAMAVRLGQSLTETPSRFEITLQ